MMSDSGVATQTVPASQLHSSLWRCERCNLFISIHAGYVVSEAFCPVCLGLPLKLCGTFEDMLGIRFDDA